MFTNFNREGHKSLSAEISQELTALAARHGLTISAGGGSIGADSLTIKIVATTNDNSAIEDKAKKELQWAGRHLGLGSEDYGAVFLSQGKRYKLTGVSGSRPKFPISAECMSTGRTFKMTAACARRIIANRPATIAATVGPPVPAFTPPSAPVGSMSTDALYAELEAFSQF